MNGYPNACQPGEFPIGAGWSYQPGTMNIIASYPHAPFPPYPGNEWAFYVIPLVSPSTLTEFTLCVTMYY